jgi:hypothetical protein
MKRILRSTSIAVFGAVVIVLHAACGGAALEGGSKAPIEGAEPATVPDALAELDRAEAELASAMGTPTFAAPPAQPGATPPRDAEAAQPSPSPAAQASESFPTAPQDPCVTCCRALASMGRAAEHLCGLAGEGDERCENARARVGRATDRVRAQCPVC